MLCALIHSHCGISIILTSSRKFPGPRIAAATMWYEFHYDVVLPGRIPGSLKSFTISMVRFLTHFSESETKQNIRPGPIIRISPEEIHIRDPNAYDMIYPGPSGGKRNKWHWSPKMFGDPLSTFGTESHDLHRLRRGLLANYFSCRSVTALEPLIRSLFDSMCIHIREHQKPGQPVNMTNAYASLTMDITTEYSFENSYHCIESKDFERGKHFADALLGVNESAALLKQFGWLLPVMKSMPLSMVKRLNPPVALLIGCQNVLLFGSDC